MVQESKNRERGQASGLEANERVRFYLRNYFVV